MPPDDPADPRLELARQWMRKAHHDLLTAERMAQPEAVPDIVVFHCQQAAEKALKAYLTWRDRPFRRTHELGDLLVECIALEPAFAILKEAADTLTPYAVDPRYPGEDAGMPSADEMDEALPLAQQVMTFVGGCLPGAVASS